MEAPFTRALTSEQNPHFFKLLWREMLMPHATIGTPLALFARTLFFALLYLLIIAAFCLTAIGLAWLCFRVL